MNVITEFEKTQLRTDLPEFRAGDTVAVHYNIKEGDRRRNQIFEGVVIAKKGGRCCYCKKRRWFQGNIYR
jgi:large subunit ribosomal protein L19